MYVGDQKVWPATPSFTRQRINKSGSWSAPFYVDTVVAGWVPDAMFPGEVVSDGLQVSGSAQAVVSAQLNLTTGWNSPTITLRRNGSVIATHTTAPQKTTTTVTLSATVDMADGDLITVTYLATALEHYVTAGSYIDVAPA